MFWINRAWPVRALLVQELQGAHLEGSHRHFKNKRKLQNGMRDRFGGLIPSRRKTG